MMEENKIIEVKNLKKFFWKQKGFALFKKELVKAVNDVSFSVALGDTFGLVGESGCGKSTLAKLIVGILKPCSGSIIVHGEKDIVFQDPHSSLNPRMTIRDIISEPLLIKGMDKNEIKSRVKRILNLVKLYNPAFVMDKFPHQFSGGERQRIAIARALARYPDVLVLDEPVSSLDVSIQAGILNLLKDLQKELKLTFVFISHDLRVVEFMADVVAVMKNGRFEEIASKEELYSCPKSEYTRTLLRLTPDIGNL